MREARITARLHHPYAVAVFDVVEHEGQPCLVMQFVPVDHPGHRAPRPAGRCRSRRRRRWAPRSASALAAAHAAGIVHRDVKPGNILIAEDGTALISDFGIAHALGDVTLTATGLVHGTPAYLAPEVARGGEATFASDVFSLGSTLYAALEGTPPFGSDANSLALLHRVAAAEFPPPSRSGPLTELITQMLSADPADRPAMSEVAHRLDELSRPEPVPLVPVVAAAEPSAAVVATAEPSAAAAASSAPTFEPARAVVTPAPTPDSSTSAEPVPPRRRRWPAAAAVAVLVAVAVLLGVLVWPGSPESPTAADGPSSTQPTDVPSATSSVGASSAPRTVPPSASAPPATTSEPAPTAGRTTAPEATREPTPEPTREPTRASNPPTAGQLAQAIRSYYALMPTGH